MDFEAFVLAAATADLDDEPAAREHADAVEFRMDLASDPLGALDDYDGELPLVATNRARWEGGEAGGDAPGDAADRDRLRDLATAAEHAAVEAVDVELACFETETAGRAVDRTREQGVSVIASVHDFDGTPDSTELRDLLAAAVEAGDVGKLAVTAEDTGDALALLRATHQFASRGEQVATMAMGESGRHTRAVAPVYGSRIGYAPVDPAEATAPGQYDLGTLRRLIDVLSGGGSVPDPE